MSKLPVRTNFLRSLAAVLGGNAIYFLALPWLPATAHHRPMTLDWGLVIDAWFCLALYGLIAMLSRTAK